MDESQENNSSNEASSSNKKYIKSDNSDSTESSQRMTEFEHKVQRLMSLHMDKVLSDLREDITNASDPSNKEDLEKAYSKEVDFKLEVDSLTSKLEKKLNVDSSSNDFSQDKKRAIKEVIDSNNKKTK
jgi:hypothetical protein